jgi:hypothetical protein
MVNHKVSPLLYPEFLSEMDFFVAHNGTYSNKIYEDEVH